MNWENLFSKTILTRGMSYYKAGHVKNIKKQGDEYRATVTGTRSYRVSLTIKDDRLMKMHCTCPYADGGARCKHMAAALYALEAQKEKLFEQEEIKFAEAEAETDEEADTFPQNYTYFDCAAMKEEMDWPVSLWRKAVKLAKDGAVVMDSAQGVYVGEYGLDLKEMQADIQGHMEQGKNKYTVTLRVNKNHFLQGVCGVRGCSHYYVRSRYGRNELCVHQAALFYHFKEYLKEHSVGDATDWKGCMFLNGIRRKSTSQNSLQTAGSAELLELEPRLQPDYSGWSVSFRIGGTKKYVVKNLTELISCSQKGGDMKFGASTTWNVHEDNFTEQGKRCLKYIRNVVTGEQMRAIQLSHNYYDLQMNRVEIKGSIPLFGRYLDDFFDLMESGRVEYTEKSEQGKKTEFLLFAHKNPHICLTLKKEEDEKEVFQGVRVLGELPEIVYGQNTGYYMENGCLNRMDEEYARRLEALLSLEDDGSVSFVIGRNQLRDFYYSVLPWLSEHVEIVENDAEEIMGYLPPEAGFIFYLDLENSNVTCRAEAVYGEQRASLMDVLGEKHADTLFAGDIPRDMEREAAAAEQVLEFFPYINVEHSLFHCNAEEDIIYRVLEQGLERLLALGEVQATDRFKRLNIRRAPKLSVGVSIQSGLLDLSLSSEQIPQDELLAVLNSYKKKKKFHRLKNGDYLKLEENSIEALGQLMEACQLSAKDLAGGKLHLPAYRALYLDKLLEKNEEIYTRRDRHFKALVKDFKTVEDSDFEVPKDLQGVLRSYQVTGYQWLGTLDVYGFGGILADEMGLGKTIQIIAVLSAAKEAGRNEPSLIIAPASLIYNWEEELNRFAPQLSVCLITGSQQERAGKIKNSRNTDVLVTSYDLLKRDIAEYENMVFSYAVLDEAQYIKNHSTAAAKAVKVINSRVRFALTGTPIENRLSELWSIFDYLMPGFLYNYETFKRMMEAPIVKNADAKASERLKKMVAPFILRRLKADVLKDLPEKLEEVQYARFDSSQQKLYDGQVLHMKQMLGSQDEEKFQKSKIQVLAELTRLRQICCDPALCYENYTDGSAKREACMELMKSAIEAGHRLLVFSQFTSMLGLLERDMREIGISFYKITGETPKEERMRLVKAFNADSTPVFLISLKAGGTGLNLTGADVVIHYDPWWNLAVQNQATDRAHRIGQKKVVTVFKLIVKDSIEEKILRLQSAKKDLADTILNGETGGIGKLSRDELLALIEN